MCEIHIIYLTAIINKYNCIKTNRSVIREGNAGIKGKFKLLL